MDEIKLFKPSGHLKIRKKITKAGTAWYEVYDMTDNQIFTTDIVTQDSEDDNDSFRDVCRIVCLMNSSNEILINEKMVRIIWI